ncbi:hypothetical protein Q5P01_006249 [Channa striata]|uniref:Uncharacterized protein n=1 Tax=Channa striata TaxID=64152 RepID=A0AA88NCL1_CHASR|nr:hypothetical protein Q5P01_006249 [Channa striata]
MEGRSACVAPRRHGSGMWSLTGAERRSSPLSSHRPFAGTGEAAPHGSLCSLPLASCSGIWHNQRDVPFLQEDHWI